MRIVIEHVYLQKTCEKVQLKLHEWHQAASSIFNQLNY